MNRTSGRSPFPTLIVLVAALLLTRMIVLVSATHLRVHVVSRRAHMDIDSEQTTPPSNRQVTRWLQNVPTVSTPTCNTIRTVPFAARLDLNYYYMVEMDDQQDVVSGIEDAIRHAIIEALDSCDIKDRPVYEISLESVHAVATDGKRMRMQRFSMWLVNVLTKSLYFLMRRILPSSVQRKLVPHCLWEHVHLS